MMQQQQPLKRLGGGGGSCPARMGGQLARPNRARYMGRKEETKRPQSLQMLFVRSPLAAVLISMSTGQARRGQQQEKAAAAGGAFFLIKWERENLGRTNQKLETVL
jgi:hypothetical protein